MRRRGARVGRSRGVELAGLALAFVVVGLAACGDGSGGGDTTAVAGDASSGVPAGNEKILIKTSIEIHIPKGGPVPGQPISDGKVLAGSSLGDSSFCPDGTFTDMHSDDPDIGFVDRTFDCADGTLRIGFTPGAPEGRTQSATWKVISGTGSFEGLEGGGSTKVTYEPGTQATQGHEVFKGTVAA